MPLQWAIGRIHELYDVRDLSALQQYALMLPTGILHPTGGADDGMAGYAAEHARGRRLTREQQERTMHCVDSILTTVRGRSLALPPDATASRPCRLPST
jgi:hypothetical protein